VRLTFLDNHHALTVPVLAGLAVVVRKTLIATRRPVSCAFPGLIVGETSAFASARRAATSIFVVKAQPALVGAFVRLIFLGKTLALTFLVLAQRRARVRQTQIATRAPVSCAFPGLIVGETSAFAGAASAPTLVFVARARPALLDACVR
jgi:hypothetical protein